MHKTRIAFAISCRIARTPQPDSEQRLHQPADLLSTRTNHARTRQSLLHLRDKRAQEVKPFRRPRIANNLNCLFRELCVRSAAAVHSPYAFRIAAEQYNAVVGQRGTVLSAKPSTHTCRSLLLTFTHLEVWSLVLQT